MKITREEYKELVNICQEAWCKFVEYSDVINEELLTSLIFPPFDWLTKKLGLEDEEYGVNYLLDLVSGYSENGLVVEWTEPNEDGEVNPIRYSSNPIEIYDIYMSDIHKE